MAQIEPAVGQIWRNKTTGAYWIITRLDNKLNLVHERTIYNKKCVNSRHEACLNPLRDGCDGQEWPYPFSYADHHKYNTYVRSLRD